MKIMPLSLSVLLAWAPLCAPASGPDGPGRKVMVMAHRGCWQAGAPELSIAAIEACDAIGPDMIEIDVRRTRDGALVLMHDDTVDRTTDGRGAVADLTLDQLRALRLRARDGGADAPLTGERVPTLAEALRAAKGRSIVNLHLKVPLGREIADVVERAGMAGRVTTWISGEAGDAAPERLGERGGIGLIPVVHECAPNGAAACRPWHVEALADHAHRRPVGFYVIPERTISSERSQAFVRSAMAAPRPEGSWIMASTLVEVDEMPPRQRADVWCRLIGLGVDLVMTDRPAEFLDVVRSQARGGCGFPAP